MATKPSTSILVIGDRKALAWILTEERTAFPANRARAAGRLTEGDRLLIYTTRGCFKNPTRDRGRVIGEATVLSPVLPLEEPVTFGDRAFPVGCDLRIDSLAPLNLGVDLSTLVELMTVFSVKASWAVYLRRPVLQLNDADAKIVRGKLKKVAVAPSDAIEGYIRQGHVGSNPTTR
jgi:hypothetical protein